jgi:hypothetical protein
MNNIYDTSILPGFIKHTYIKYQSTILVSLITATLLLVTLAWNEVVQESISLYYPKETRQTLIGKIYYAVIITIIVVILQIFIFPYFTENKAYL